jgi:hypothetical protein
LYLVISCSNSTNPANPVLPGDLPVVEQLVVTSERGDVLGIWYNPGYMLTIPAFGTNHTKMSDVLLANKPIETTENSIESGYIPVEIEVIDPYPNPTAAGYGLTIGYSIPTESVVSIWIVPAIASEAEADKADFFPSQLFWSVSHGTYVVAELCKNETRTAGRYAISWRGTDNNQNQVADGFYRIYYKVDDYFDYKDIYLYRQDSDLPESLKKLMIWLR